MQPERYAQIKRVLQAVMDQPVAQRGELLDLHCSNDAAMRAEVEQLLAAGEAITSRFSGTSAGCAGTS